MTRLFSVFAAAAMSTCLCGPMLAQSTTAPASPDQTAPSQSMPSNSQTMPNSSMSSPAQGQIMATDLTGQTIYSSKGSKIGTVSSMSTDTHGQQAASVSVEKYLGMGGQTVLIPVSSLQARDAGGYTTSLSASEIKALGKAGSSSPTP